MFGIKAGGFMEKSVRNYKYNKFNDYQIINSRGELIKFNGKLCNFKNQRTASDMLILLKRDFYYTDIKVICNKRFL